MRAAKYGNHKRFNTNLFPQTKCGVWSLSNRLAKSRIWTKTANGCLQKTITEMGPSSCHHLLKFRTLGPLPKQISELDRSGGWSVHGFIAKKGKMALSCTLFLQIRLKWRSCSLELSFIQANNQDFLPTSKNEVSLLKSNMSQPFQLQPRCTSVQQEVFATSTEDVIQRRKGNVSAFLFCGRQ